MIKLTILAILFVGVAHAGILQAPENLIGKEFAIPAPKANEAFEQWLDEILANVRRVMVSQGLDSVDIPPFGWNFSEVVLGVRWHGEATITEGVIKGLETLHRTGAADIVYEGNDLLVSVDAGVNAGTLGAKLTAKFMNLGPVATISGTIKNVAVRLTIRLHFGDTTSAKLEKLNIKSLGTLTVDVKGLGLVLNFLAESASYIFGNLVKDVVATVIEIPLRAIINSLLPN